MPPASWGPILAAVRHRRPENTAILRPWPGRALAAFALTESQAGSDAAPSRPPGEDGDFYVLNGTKQWITNAEKPSSTPSSPSQTGPKGPGSLARWWRRMTRHLLRKKEKKMASGPPSPGRWSWKTAAFLRTAPGETGLGFIITMKTWTGRPAPGPGGGLAQSALDEPPLCQGATPVRGPIFSFRRAASARQHGTQIEAPGLVYAVAAISTANQGLSKEGAMAKLFATDMAMQVPLTRSRSWAATATCGNTRWKR